MSDGPSMCARAAEKRARDFVKKRFPKVKEVLSQNHVPADGLVVLIYEEWLDHVVELIQDRRVIGRWRVGSFDSQPTRKIPITNKDYSVAHYEHNPFPRRSFCG